MLVAIVSMLAVIAVMLMILIHCINDSYFKAECQLMITKNHVRLMHTELCKISNELEEMQKKNAQALTSLSAIETLLRETYMLHISRG